MKRVITFILLLSLFTSNLLISYAASSDTPPSNQRKIIVYLKPDVSVEFNNVKQAFRDLNGSVVYPIIYNGSTYLPIRAVSGIMKEPIEWDGASKTIFIGRTLSNPNKTSVDTSTASAIAISEVDESRISLKADLVNAYLKPDILVMYDFTLQTFIDVNGVQIYPIIYNGTTYLPIRAISELMKEPIEWDGIKKTVYIGDGEETQQENTVEEEEVSLATKNLISLFEREEVLYYEATAKTTSLKDIVSLDEKQIIATAISDNYLQAQNLTLEIKAVDISNYTDEEIATYNKLIAFAESTEYYILVLENIAYLAAQDSDYSMLAETFLYFAMDCQTKMEETRTLVQGLNQ